MSSFITFGGIVVVYLYCIFCSPSFIVGSLLELFGIRNSLTNDNIFKMGKTSHPPIFSAIFYIIIFFLWYLL